MAHIVRLQTFGNSMMTTHKKVVEEHLKKLAQGFPKDYAIFNVDVYLKSNLTYEYPEDTMTIGIKADGIYLGEDTTYWKILTKQILKNWWNSIKYKLQSHD